MSELINERVYRIMESTRDQRFRHSKTQKEILVTGVDHSLNELEYRYENSKALRRMDVSRFVNTFDRIVQE